LDEPGPDCGEAAAADDDGTCTGDEFNPEEDGNDNAAPLALSSLPLPLSNPATAEEAERALALPTKHPVPHMTHLLDVGGQRFPSPTPPSVPLDVSFPLPVAIAFFFFLLLSGLFLCKYSGKLTSW
jgi:hypothetical protein